jgi:hypothetical protein
MSLTPLVKAEIFNALNKVFFLVVYNNRFRWRCVLARYVFLLLSCEAEEGYMEYRMYLHRFR